MNNFWKRVVLVIETLLLRLKGATPEQKLHDQEVNRAVERVVDEVNPRLRAVGRYRRKLYPVVERAMAHVEELSRKVPGPILVNGETWSGEPMVNALFGSVDRMRRVLSGPEVRRYVKQHPVGGDCYAVLAAVPDVRCQLGVELVGDALQKDVRQTAVSFLDQEVALAGESEEKVRQALAEDVLDLLVSFALQDILEQESRVSEIEERLRVVRLKLRVAGTRTRGAGLLLDDDPDRRTAHESLTARVAELEKDLEREKRGLTTLDDYLDRLVEQLTHPEVHIGLETVRVRLDRMNIVREDADEAAGAEIEFARGRRGDTPGRVVALIRFPRSELLEAGSGLREAERYLG
jgi:hypothetical protein